MNRYIKHINTILPVAFVAIILSITSCYQSWQREDKPLFQLDSNNVIRYRLMQVGHDNYTAEIYLRANDDEESLTKFHFNDCFVSSHIFRVIESNDTVYAYSYTPLEEQVLDIQNITFVIRYNPKINHFDLVRPFSLNGLQLISADTTIPQLKLDLSLSYDAILEHIQSAFETDINEQIVYFSAPFNIYSGEFKSSIRSIPLKLRLNHHPNGFYGERHRAIRILINQYGNRMLNGHVCQPDSLMMLFSHYYLISDDPLIECPDHSFVSFNWQEGMKSSDISNTLRTVIQAYLETADVVSINTFGVMLPKLNESQLDSIKKIFPFELELSLYSPPAPPDEIENHMIEVIDEEMEVWKPESNSQ